MQISGVKKRIRITTINSASRSITAQKLSKHCKYGCLWHWFPVPHAETADTEK